MTLAHNLSLVCDLTLPSPSVSFLAVPGSTASQLHPRGSECVFSLESETDRRHLQNTQSAPVWNTSTVLVHLCPARGNNRTTSLHLDNNGKNLPEKSVTLHRSARVSLAEHVRLC
ncbi:hypothetical protein AOLI_G00088630 [Acnodon oligacanthus]